MPVPIPVFIALVWFAELLGNGWVNDGRNVYTTWENPGYECGAESTRAGARPAELLMYCSPIPGYVPAGTQQVLTFTSP